MRDRTFNALVAPLAVAATIAAAAAGYVIGSDQQAEPEAVFELAPYAAPAPEQPQLQSAAWTPPQAEAHRVTLECHGGRTIVLAVCKGRKECDAYADDYFQEESSEADFLCRPHQWEVNSK